MVNNIELATKIMIILCEVLPKNVFKMLEERNNLFNKGKYFIIGFAASQYKINDIDFQYPQFVSLRLDIETMELHPQVFGGSGGQFIYRKPDMNCPKEKFLAMKSLKIPFRKPQENEEAVLRAIKRFGENWVQALKDNKEVLMYQNYVDYDELLK